MKSLLRTVVLATSLLGFAGAGWTAEGKATRVSEHGDWAVFVDKSPKECWSVSLPKKSVNTRGGRTVSVKRSDILLFVFFSPAGKVSEQVTFTGGYPFAEDKAIKLKVDDKSFKLSLIQGEWAWAGSSEEDVKLVKAMKAGGTATLTAVSKRGTQTVDTFSLKGFTAASDAAKKNCSG